MLCGRAHLNAKAIPAMRGLHPHQWIRSMTDKLDIVSTGKDIGSGVLQTKLKRELRLPRVKKHRLEPLLNPESIALVGASKTRDKPGNDMIKELVVSRFSGEIYLVNPRHETIWGAKCFDTVSELPAVPDIACIATPTRFQAEVLEDAVAAGVKSAVLFGDAGSRKQRQKIKDIARQAQIPVMGGNSMGFYNVDYNIRCHAFHHRDQLAAGPLAFISHSGSTLSAFLFNDPRFGFNFAVSPGQELVTTAADYLDYALTLPTTCVVAMVLEAVRAPEQFEAGLQKARDLGIPVVVLKLGTSATGAKLAMSHSGAMAGDSAAFSAMCRHYNVVQVECMEELATVSQMFSQYRRTAPPSPGCTAGIGVILDSGGERELLVDIAQAEEVHIPDLQDETVRRLERVLAREPGIEAMNPLDAWGTGRDFEKLWRDALKTIMQDPNCAVGVVVADLTSELALHDGFVDATRSVLRNTEKPVMLLSNYSAANSGDISHRLALEGIPVLDGTRNGLRSIKKFIDYCSNGHSQQKTADLLPGPPEYMKQAWRARLAKSTDSLTEAEAYELLLAYGIPVPRFRTADSATTVRAAADEVGFPLALKTNMPGIMHKTEVGGVQLNIKDHAALAEAYDTLSQSCGAEVMLASMAPSSSRVEMAMGVLSDPTYGTNAVVAAGGTLIEVLNRKHLERVPFGVSTAAECVDQLGLQRLLGPFRGQPAIDADALAQTLSRLSRLADDLGDLLAEMDINPVLCGPDGVVAVDALVIPAHAVTAKQHAQGETSRVEAESTFSLSSLIAGADPTETGVALVCGPGGESEFAAVGKHAKLQLPPGDVVVAVTHSTLNYKDGLGITGKAPIFKQWPMVPGIDLAGSVVRASADSGWSEGDAVVLTGHGVGEKHWGGLSTLWRGDPAWLVPNLVGSGLDAMRVGTAGLTAMLCVMELERGGLTPEHGPVVVTGACGGVGSVAVNILSKEGYDVVAVSSRADEETKYLQSLGAQSVLPRDELNPGGEARPLDKQLYAAAVDVAGGSTLSHLLSKMKYGGMVAACGLADSLQLPTTMAPFILRGVSLMGVDSVYASRDIRLRAWERLGDQLDMQQLSEICTTADLSTAPDQAEKLLQGQVRGRIVIDCQSLR